MTIDSREIGPGDLFVGIPGEHVDGGSFAAMALAAGAWGVLVTREWAAEALEAERGRGAAQPERRSPRSARWRAPGGATSPRT